MYVGLGRSLKFLGIWYFEMRKKRLKNVPDSISEHSFLKILWGSMCLGPPGGRMLMHALSIDNFIQNPPPEGMHGCTAWLYTANTSQNTLFHTSEQQKEKQIMYSIATSRNTGRY